MIHQYQRLAVGNHAPTPDARLHLGEHRLEIHLRGCHQAGVTMTHPHHGHVVTGETNAGHGAQECVHSGRIAPTEQNGNRVVGKGGFSGHYVGLLKRGARHREHSDIAGNARAGKPRKFLMSSLD